MKVPPADLFAKTLLILAVGYVPQALGQPAPADPQAGASRVVRDGVVVEFSIAPTAAGQGTGLIEGGAAEVKFRLTDEGSGTPLSGLYPGAWMDVGQTAQPEAGTAGQSCRDKVGLYLKNIVGIRPLVDLNDYFLLALNREPSISVISPRVGISGRTNLLARIQLKQPGADWAKTRDHKRLFVTMPAARQVAVVDTETFKVISGVDAGANPLRAVLQADEKYLWVGNDSPDAAESGVTVIDAAALTIAARIPTGRGHHEIVLSAGDRYALVSNRDGGTVSVVDVQKLEIVKELRTGPLPISLAHSPLSRAIYVADGKEGVISVVDSDRLEIVARIPTNPGLGPLRFTPDGRWGMAVNSVRSAVHIVDAATNRLAYTVPVDSEPYEVTFTGSFAYIRSLGSNRISLIQLALLGTESMPAPNTFPAGATPPGNAPELGIAGEIVPSPKESAAYVLSPADNAIYYYMEGMNAPSGSFQTYGQDARGIEVIDRSLREQEPGVYSTRARLPVAGRYDVAFLLDSPKQVHCFSFEAKADPKLNHHRPALKVEYLTQERSVAAGAEFRFPFRLTDPETGLPRAGLKDVSVLFFMVPGLFRTEVPAQETAEGVYEAPLTLPKAGAYYVYVASPSSNVRYGDLSYRTLSATAGGAELSGAGRSERRPASAGLP